jgi:MATE family multidrug resistance protein
MPELSGTPVPLTHRRVLAIAFPIVISGASVPLLGIVDTGVIGQLGDPVPLGGVAIGAVILGSIYWIFGFLRMGTTGLTAQAHGAGDRSEVAAMLTRGLLIGFAAGIALIALQLLLFSGAFLVSPASPEVEEAARSYMRIRILSAPAAIALFGVNGWLIGLQRTRAVLVIQLWTNGLNIALDMLFVPGFGWGVSGVALATLIAEWSGLAVGLFMCRDMFRNPAWRSRERIFDPVRLRRMASVNTDIMIRSVLLQAMSVSFLFIAAGFGDLQLAANQILVQFMQITAYALDGFAFAAEALVGQAIGARSLSSLRQSVRMTSIWGMSSALVLGAGFFLCGGWIIDLLTTSPDIRAEARVYLPYMALIPLLGAPAWMLDGFFIGATHTRDMRNMMFVSALIFALSVFALVPGLGNHGLWLAFLIAFITRGITLALRYPMIERSVDPRTRAA